jgi:hypothetical protein
LREYVLGPRVRTSPLVCWCWSAGLLASTKVGMFGKYLNNVPNFVPVGFDAWMANGGGDYIAPSFSTARVPGLPDGGWHGNQSDYTTAVVGNKVRSGFA